MVGILLFGGKLPPIIFIQETPPMHCSHCGHTHVFGDGLCRACYDLTSLIESCSIHLNRLIEIQRSTGFPVTLKNIAALNEALDVYSQVFEKRRHDNGSLTMQDM